MRAASDSYVLNVLLALDSPQRRARVVARRVRTFAASAFDPYRPELYYMRGPGPKWRKKIQKCASTLPT